MDTVAHDYAGYATFLLAFSAIVSVDVLLCYMSFKVRAWKRSAEEKLAMVQLQVKMIHQAEYADDQNSVEKKANLNANVVAAYLYLAGRCDAIYEPEMAEGGEKSVAVTKSLDSRISCEEVSVESKSYLVVTVRGTKILEDLLWDVDINGVSPGADLANDPNKLSTNLMRVFNIIMSPDELGAKLTQKLTQKLKVGKIEALQVSNGSWQFAKCVLLHVVQFLQAQEKEDYVIKRGGSVHGCRLLKITSRNFSLLEVLRGGSNYQVILGNYLEAGNLFLSAAQELFL